LTVQQAYSQAVLNLAQVQANRYSDTAMLLQALGGGRWNGGLPTLLRRQRTPGQLFIDPRGQS
jgi:hypothetical protein